MKIRGTATHIAEKYGALARDAHASGDVITAENYFQHAEHYNRIIAAAQAQMTPAGAPQPGDGANGAGGQRSRRGGDATSQPAVAAVPEGEDAAAAPTEEPGEEADSAASRKKSGNGADTSEEPAAAANGSGQSQDADPANSSDDAPPDNAVA